jgi:predicted PurR-regulated permease PerM
VEVNASTQWRPATRYIVALGLALFGLVALNASRFLIPIVVLAALFAYLIRPLQLFLNRQLGLRWGLAVLLVYLALIALFVLALVFLVPAVIGAFKTLIVAIRDTLVDLAQQLESTLTRLKDRDFAVGGIDALVEGIVNPALTALEKGPDFSVSLPSSFNLSTAIGLVGSVASLFWKLGLLLLTAIWLSLDADKLFGRMFDGLSDSYRPEVTTLFTRLLGCWDNYVRGEVVLMLTMGTVVAIGNLVLGTPGALALGILSGFMEIIPGIGPAIALIPAVAIALVEGSTHLAVDNLVFAIIVLVFYLGVQVLENQLLIPKIMGDAEEMHPLLIILGIAVGGSLFGLVGAVLTVPTLASLREILRYLIRKIRGQPPFPPEEEEQEDDETGIWRREFGHDLESRIKGFRQRLGGLLDEDDEPSDQKPQEIPGQA